MDIFEKQLSYLRGEIPFSIDLYNTLNETINFAYTNQVYSIYFNRALIKNLDELYAQLRCLHFVLTKKEIKNEEFRDLYIKSMIPFKSVEQFFLFDLLTKYYKVEIKGYTFSDILDTLEEIYSKINYDTSLMISIRDNINNDHSSYNVKEKTNGVDYFREQELLAKNIYISEHQDKKGEIEIIGVRGEREYSNLLKNNHNALSVWVSKDVDKFSHFDFIEYDPITNKIIRTEVKSTTIDYHMADIFITKDEKDILIKSLPEENEIFVVRKKLFDKYLNKELGENIVTINDADNFELEGVSKRYWNLLYKKGDGIIDLIGGVEIPNVLSHKKVGLEFQSVKSLTKKS